MAALAALGAPLLFVDFDAMAFGQNSIVVDFAGSVKTIVQEFLAQGHQKIGMLSGQEYTKESHVALVDPRFVAFKETLKDLDLYHQEWVVEAAFSVEEGYQAMKDFIEEADTRPTAFSLQVIHWRLVQCGRYKKQPFVCQKIFLSLVLMILVSQNMFHQH